MPFDPPTALRTLGFLTGLAALVQAAPSAAHQQPGHTAAADYRAAWQQARDGWVAECRATRTRERKARSIAGAVVGSIAGGLVGSAVAAPGDKTLGTVAGAAVGTAAGAALGASADRRAERRALDWCEGYLERFPAWSAAADQPAYGQTWGYRPMLVAVPVAITQPAAAPPPRECTETQVIEEDVPIGPARRVMPKRAPAPPAKRVPDKRVPIG